MPEKFDLEAMEKNILKKLRVPKPSLIGRLRGVAGKIRKPPFPRPPRI